jgi:hypothetical protein
MNNLKTPKVMKRANRLNRKRIENMYIDYFNNFLSIQRFADHYDLEIETAYRIIDIGRELNHLK